MASKKIFQLLNALNVQEQQFLKEYISLNVYVKNEKVKQLYTILTSLEDHSLLDKVEIFKKLFPNTQYDDQQFRLVNSRLLKTLEKGLIDYLAQKDEIKHQILLLRYYRERGLATHFNSTLRKIQGQLDKYGYDNAEFHEVNTSIQLELHEFAQGQKRSKDPNIQELLSALDIEYISKKLRYMCLSAAHSNVFKEQFDIGLGEDVLNVLQQGHFSEVASISLYYRCYLMLSDLNNNQYFLAFRNELNAKANLFPQEEVRSLYLLGINYCIRWLNQGDLNYGKIGLELYKESLAKELMLVNGYLSRFTYRNIATMAIRVGEFDWAETFSESYKSRVRKNHAESAYFLNLALIRYHKRQLDESLDALLRVNFKDALITLAVRLIQMKIYFEQKEFLVLDSHLEAMKMFIIRNKVIGYHKENYLNIIKYTRKLLRKHRMSDESRTKIIDQVKSVNPLTERQWLLEQWL